MQNNQDQNFQKFLSHSTAECTVDSDCPFDRSCVREKCIDPCTTTQCGRGANCLVNYHKAFCECPKGTQGDPRESCIYGHCQYNEDCADHEACDRLNRVCRPVCDKNSCGRNAYCKGSNHGMKI